MRTVAIVGRPNVGKSALFNRLARRRISIVHDQPGVTRDRIIAECKLGQAPFMIIDTGGIGSDVDTSFTDQVQQEVDLAIETSDVLLLVVDGQSGLTPVDETLARQLRRTDKPIVLVVNKVDHEKHAMYDVEFAQLGMDHVICTSAEHGRGLPELLECVEGLLPAEHEPSAAEENQAIDIAIVGRPNVGKSSMINAILEDKRTLVSPISGTTRDAVDIPYERGNHKYTLIDTAGIRPRGKQENSVEIFSVMRSERTIRRADICVLVVDASMGVTAQDKKIAGLIQEAQKPCVVAVNKWDLVKKPGSKKEQLEELIEEIRSELFFVDYAPILLLSALHSEGLSRLFRMIEQVREASLQRITTGPLNRLLEQALTAHPPPSQGGKRLKIVYATQVDRDEKSAVPIPGILLFVNQADLLVSSYRKYLDSKIREEVAWTGLPILFFFREREARGRRAHIGK